MERDAISIDHQPAANLPSQRKRKAEGPANGNERLSKRLSLLNLEHNGSRLYVPVENPTEQPSTAGVSPSSTTRPRKAAAQDDSMQLDDTKYKVYIYNLEDELSSSDGEGDDDGKLIFLPDIEDHLRNNRIPPHVLSNPAADAKGREMVLYNVPSAISVPEEQDSVRKAIIEARARIREKQTVGKKDEEKPGETRLPPTIPLEPAPMTNGTATNTLTSLPVLPTIPEDVDAMEID